MMNTPSRLLNSFHIAGFTHYEGPLALRDLAVGTKLKLVTEPENRHDDFAVAIYKDKYKLGYIPRHSNKFIALLLQNGYEAFETIVQQVDGKEHPEEQVLVGVYVKNKKA